ncbi:chaplin [Streptomyces siamensis]|uniref:Chaplin n=1 Tax=Streptomyces siamensis TaxID=1274986 RepID=A0ABP9IGX9_9ACTN
MVVAAAATSIVSLYGNPAFADAGAEGVAADSPGIASGNNVQVPLNVPVNACGNTVDVVALLNPAFGNSCANGPGSRGTSGTSSVPGVSHQPVQHDDSGYGYDDSGYGYDDTGYGYDDTGYGYDDSEHTVTPGPYGGSSAHGEATGSPGVLSGGLFQVPVDVPVNACGNTVDVVSALNPAFGNECGYGDTPPSTPPPTTTPPTTPPPTTPPPSTPPPTTTPPSTPPPTTPPPASTPPASTPPPPVEEQTPPPPGGTLPHTGSEGTLAASAASAALLAGGILLYRRGRAASRR